MNLGLYKTYNLCLYLSLCALTLFSNKAFSQTDSLDIYDLSLTQLSKIKITTASKVSQSISEIPSTVYIVTADEIKEKGYFTLEEILTDLPGFQFRNTLGINSYIFQRGVPNQNNLTLVLIDGVQVNELNSGGFYGGGQYNLSNIERVEVIYGPSSVAYGTNAVTGIINIITKNPLGKKVEINTLFGSFNTTESDLNYCYVNKKKTFGLSVSGMIKKSDKANLRGSAGDNNWTDLMDNFENDYTLNLKIQTKDFIFGTDYMYKQASTATNTKSLGTIYRDFGSSWNIPFINNYIKYNKNILKKLSLSSILYNRNTTVLNNTVYSVVDTAQIGFYRPNNLSGFENILNYNPCDFFSITSGLTIELEQLSKTNTFSYSNSPFQRPPKPEKPEIVNNSLVSIFIEPRVTLFKSLYLSGGVRYDKSNVYDQVLTPRAGLNYHFNEHILRFSYAEAFRAPKPWDYSDGIGNPSLLPEKIKSLEAALTISIADDYKLDLVGYRNNFLNVLTKEIINSDYRWTNSGKINNDGVEIFFRFGSHKIKSSINYTYNLSYDEFGALATEISKHSGNASFTYSLSNYVKLNLRANYVGKKENPKIIISTNRFDVDPYLIFNGALSLVNYKGFTVQFIIKNILNTEYYHTSNRDPDRYRQPQQTIMFSVGYNLSNLYL